MWMSETWRTRSGPHARRQYRDGDPSQPEGAGFEARRVDQAGRADRREAQGYSVSRAHASIVADPAEGAVPARACGHTPHALSRSSRQVTAVPQMSGHRTPRSCHNQAMTTLKSKLQEDLTTAIKARDELRSATLRLTLSAITKEEVAGTSARELSDDEVQKVIAGEAKKRREAAEAFAQGGRAEQAERERAEGEVLAGLPAPAAVGRRAGADRRRGRRGGGGRGCRGAAGDGRRHEDRQPEGGGPGRGRPGRRSGQEAARRG